MPNHYIVLVISACTIGTADGVDSLSNSSKISSMSDDLDNLANVGQNCCHTKDNGSNSSHSSDLIDGSSSWDSNNFESRTKLANMPVVGRFCTIVDKTSKPVEVRPFSNEYNKILDVPVVDAAIKWEDLLNGDVHYLLVKNALYAPSMEHNLIHPFVMREAGIIVNDIPKIHVRNPQVKDHGIYFEESKVRIPLSLIGVFSYFPTSKPSEEELKNIEDILLLTPVNN